VNPLRLEVRFAPARPVSDLEPAIGLFHRFIQNGRVEGLILDVADYRHVQDGPGVVLVGHDVDYGISTGGLTITRKRSADDAGTQVRDAIRMGLGALDAIAYDGALDVAISRTRLSVAAYDRRVPRDEVAAELRDAVAGIASELYGVDAQVALLTQDDARRAPVVEVTLTETAGDVLEKLGGSRAPGQSPWDVTVEELAGLLEKGEDFVLLDVREPTEYEVVKIGGTLMPLATLPQHLDEIDRNARIVAYCRSGHRSANAVALLRESGFGDAWSLNGGLMSWIDRIDPSLQRY
jgi:rhodanese-related sulfurtransferase